jgi:UPF0716 protein FxsA
VLWLFVLALLLSLADAVFLLVVAGYIGWLQTVGLVVLTALLGVVLVRSQGRSTILRIQRKLQQGESPAAELIDGVMIIFGAGLLITPGLLTDLTGFLLVFPLTRVPIRVVLRRWIVGPYLRRKIEEGTINVQFGGTIGGNMTGAGGGWADGEVDRNEGAGGDPAWEDSGGDEGTYDLGEGEYDVDDPEDR